MGNHLAASRRRGVSTYLEVRCRSCHHSSDPADVACIGRCCPLCEGDSFDVVIVRFSARALVAHGVHAEWGPLLAVSGGRSFRGEHELDGMHVCWIGTEDLDGEAVASLLAEFDESSSAPVATFPVTSGASAASSVG